MKPYHSFDPHAVFSASQPVTLIGGAQFEPDLLAMVQAIAPAVVAADGGADQALRHNLCPERVWGDFDSLSKAARAAIPAARLCHIPEQDSTDFEKALRHIQAPLILGLGFVGERRDHELAACHALATHPQHRVILVSTHDLVCLAPADLRLPTRRGERVSLFPLGPVTGHSSGLKWPIDGVAFSPLSQIGTSNKAVADEVHLRFDLPAMLMVLPKTMLPRLVPSLLAADPW